MASFYGQWSDMVLLEQSSGQPGEFSTPYLLAAAAEMAVSFIIILAILGAIWALASFGLRRISMERGAVSNVLTGVISGGFFLMVISLIAIALNPDGPNWSAIRYLMFLLAGAAWGAVFWIRAPKPTTAGIAA
jgi:predicted permease